MYGTCNTHRSTCVCSSSLSPPGSWRTTSTQRESSCKWCGQRVASGCKAPLNRPLNAFQVNPYVWITFKCTFISKGTYIPPGVSVISRYANIAQHAFDLHSHAGRLCLHRDRIGSEGLRGEAAEQPACPRDRLAPPRVRRGEVSGTSLGVSELHTGLMLLPFGFVLNWYTIRAFGSQSDSGPLTPSPSRSRLRICLVNCCIVTQVEFMTSTWWCGLGCILWLIPINGLSVQPYVYTRCSWEINVRCILNIHMILTT